jgi:hypothetical protein
LSQQHGVCSTTHGCYCIIYNTNVTGSVHSSVL